MAVALVFCVGTGANASTPLLNGSFETRDLSGWLRQACMWCTSVGAPPWIMASPYPAVDGSSYLAVAGYSDDAWQEVTQSFTMESGSRISGYAAFVWLDYTIFMDGARVQVLDATGNVVATPFYEDGEGKPFEYRGSWTAWSFTAPTSGIYTLALGSRNTRDGTNWSLGLFDAISVTDAPLVSPVPEPGSLLLGTLGLAVVAGRVRRRRPSADADVQPTGPARAVRKVLRFAGKSR